MRSGAVVAFRKFEAYYPPTTPNPLVGFDWYVHMRMCTSFTLCIMLVAGYRA